MLLTFLRRGFRSSPAFRFGSISVPLAFLLKFLHLINSNIGQMILITANKRMAIINAFDEMECLQNENNKQTICELRWLM